MTIDKSKLLKTVGWASVGIGLYMVGLGISYDGESIHINPRKTSDDIIDAEFTIIED